MTHQHSWGPTVLCLIYLVIELGKSQIYKSQSRSSFGVLLWICNLCSARNKWKGDAPRPRIRAPCPRCPAQTNRGLSTEINRVLIMILPICKPYMHTKKLLNWHFAKQILDKSIFFSQFQNIFLKTEKKHKIQFSQLPSTITGSSPNMGCICE